jgi:hypothetical protein
VTTNIADATPHFRMTITYANTRRDLLAFQLHHFRRSPIVWLPVALLGLMFFLMAPDDALATRIVAAMIFLALVLPILLAFYAAALTLNLLLRKDRNSAPETVTLSDAGLQIKTATSFQDHQWTGIKKVCRTRRHLFIYLTPSIACIVPRRAFASADEWEAFSEFCRRKTIKLKQVQPPP